jgi:enediyne biosynthesis protein E4
MFGAILLPLRRGFAAAPARLVTLGSVGWLGACVWLVACGGDRSGTRTESPPRDDRTPEPAWFIDATASTGLNFIHFNGMTGEFYYPEVIAPGVALFDYDNDGDLDVFLVQGSRFRVQGAGSGFRVQGSEEDQGSRFRGRLYRNDLEVRPDGGHVVRFTDVTEASGIKTSGYGMGVAVGDYNNDGCPDLYVTTLGRNQLFRNDCRGGFADVSRQSGVDDIGWSVSAAFLDFDRDGWLDLYVGHYLNWDVGTNTPCFGMSGKRAYCAPRVYRAQPSKLYHNNRDGTFTDVTRAAGMATQFGPALGVTTADFNGDGWIDLYVANDGDANQLWINQHNGTFKNTALLAGVALNPRGKAKAGMGVDAGDVDDDGDEDLVVANLTGEGLDLYINDGSGVFENQSARSGLGALSLPYTGFGTAWFDADNDGALDLLIVNGAVQIIDSQALKDDPFPLRQRKQLFHNLGGVRFEDATARAGPAFETLEVGRGAAFGDIDNDGDTDVLIGNNNGAPTLLLNQIGNRNHWLGLRLLGKDAPRDMLGARVAISRTGRPALWRRARADGSYASANDPRVLVGLGAAAVVERVRVVWPDGITEEWKDVAIDRYTTLVEGTAR